MRFVHVETIPRASFNRPKKNVYDFLMDFLTSGMNYAEVVFEDGEYARTETARSSLQLACNRYGLAVDIVTRNGKLYLRRRGA